MPCMMSGRSWGADLLICPHCSIVACIFSQRWSSFLHCITWGAYYIRVSHPHVHYADGHFPMWFIVIPVGISSDVILVAHFFRILGAPMSAPFSDFKSTKFWFSLFKVPNLFRRTIIGGSRMASLRYSFIFVEIFPLGQETFFWGGSRGDFMKILHISPWIQLIWGIVDLDHWYFSHRSLDAVSKTTSMVDHLYGGAWLLSWFPLMWRHFHCIGLFRSLWSVAYIMSNWLERQENCVSGSMDFLSASITLQAMVMEPSPVL